MIEAAKRLATEAHEGQMRKYHENVPYIRHCERVALDVALRSWATPEAIAAAWLHDVLEDVAIPRNTVSEWATRIAHECGLLVLGLVNALTNPSLGREKMLRAERKAQDRQHLMAAPLLAKQIKLVDRLDNIRDIGAGPAQFVKKYCQETRLLVDDIGQADPEIAAEILEEVAKLETP